MNKSDSIAKLAQALVAAQAEVKNPAKDAFNPHFKTKYADLASVRDAVVPVFARHGLAVVQSLHSADRGPTIATTLLHSSGEWMEAGSLTIPASKQDAQGYGSAITYGRRYMLLAVAGVVGDDDDDGNAACKPQAQQAAPPKPQPATQGNGQSADFGKWLVASEAQMVGQMLCRPDEMKAAVWKAAKATGQPKTPPNAWSEEAKAAAKAEVGAFRDWATKRAAAPISAARLAQIDELALARGVDAEAVLAHVGAPDSVPSQLTGSQALRAIAWLEALPVAQPA